MQGMLDIVQGGARSVGGAVSNRFLNWECVIVMISLSDYLWGKHVRYMEEKQLPVSPLMSCIPGLEKASNLMRRSSC